MWGSVLTSASQASTALMLCTSVCDVAATLLIIHGGQVRSQLER